MANALDTMASPSQESIETLRDLESKLDVFNAKIETYLFEEISDRTYSRKINECPKLAANLRQILRDEVQVRATIHELKSLLEDISSLDGKIKQLAANKEVREAYKKEQDIRKSLLDFFAATD